MFGKKGKEPGVEKLSKPGEIPEAVGRFLVVQMKKDPDWVWNLKSVIRPKAGAASKFVFDVRVFDTARAAAKGVIVKDWTTLDGHPDLVLYEGWFDKKLITAQMEEKKKA